MFVLIKYSCIILFCVGLFGFGIYMRLCNLSDKFVAYIEKSIYGLQKEYDYIIVGAGTAGSVVALRLSEDRNVSVLLLEAGGFGGKLLDIPAITPILHKTVYDWQYETVPQKHACRAFENNSILWPLGKLIGGSGRLNYMMYTRGHPDDFKEWFKDVEDYDFQRDILEYFKKGENQIGLYSNDHKYHSSNGPLTAADLPYSSELYEAVIKAARSMGYPVRDTNGQFNSGFSQPQVSMKDGRRYSTGHHLLRHRRPNLTIKVFSHVEKVLFKNRYEAYAVKHEILGETHITRAKRAIILSAGTVGTPKILMLSGIGEKKHLQELGVKVVKQLPVGDNLQDHVSTGFDLVSLNRPLSINFYSLSSPLTHLKYLFGSSGPLMSVGCEIFALLNSACIDNAVDYNLCEKESGRPDLEYIFMPLGLAADQGIRFKHIMNLKKEIWDDYFSHFTDNYYNTTITIMPIVLHPKSTGTVRLRNRNPASAPLINPNYLSDPSDVALLVKGIRFLKKFVQTASMRELGASFNNRTFPSCASFEFDSDEYWKCYVRYVSSTVYHPVGTCKMGSELDPTSVVNRDFRVIGVNKLFLVDGSVMPTLVSGHTNAVIVMLAEKAADIIKRYKHLDEGICYLRELFLRNFVCMTF